MGIEARVKETLEAIKSAPSADSRDLELDLGLLEDLRSQGLIEASVYDRWDGGNIYSDMRVTLQGDKFLERIDSEPKKPIQPAPGWYSNPILVTILSVLAGLAVLGISYSLGWK